MKEIPSREGGLSLGCKKWQQQGSCYLVVVYNRCSYYLTIVNGCIILLINKINPQKNKNKNPF
jgi:hypothetical protein